MAMIHLIYKVQEKTQITLNYVKILLVYVTIQEPKSPNLHL